MRTLADSNIEMLSGMSQIATQLQKNSARAATDSDSSSGFYLPTNTFENRQFTDVAKQFLSPDGKTARFMIETSYDPPYSVEAMDLANQITHTANTARPNTSLAQATVSVAGFPPAVNSDIQRLLWADFAQLAIATTLIVGLILVLLLRALLAPIYLLGTVLLNYLASLGIGVLVFQWGIRPGNRLACTTIGVHHPRRRWRRLQHAARLTPARRIRSQHPCRRPAHRRKHRRRHHLSGSDLRRQHVRPHGRLRRHHDPSRPHHRRRTTTRHLPRTHTHRPPPSPHSYAKPAGGPSDPHDNNQSSLRIQRKHTHDKGLCHSRLTDRRRDHDRSDSRRRSGQLPEADRAKDGVPDPHPDTDRRSKKSLPAHSQRTLLIRCHPPWSSKT